MLIEVVEAKGLSAAGRRMNLSPATMTARLRSLEERYQSRFFNRSTRAISLTPLGEEFYHSCLRILEDLSKIEATLFQNDDSLSGCMRIGAPSDFGRQYLSPALVDFSLLHPNIKISISLSQNMVDMVANRLDLSIRYGNLPDSSLVTRSIRPNRRVLVAARSYLEKYGVPRQPDDLHHHRCLVMEIDGVTTNDWRFQIENNIQIVRVSPYMKCDDGELLRQWALAGAGIACKSWWDVKQNVQEGKLILLFPENYLGFNRSDKKSIGLQFVYPQRSFQPSYVTAFSDFFIKWLDKYD